ncbi:MAG: hypothetical protein KC449_02370 [Anaerolineales bacterium]|nr:hypothetical protein [Anaerolineales bacterium]
MNMQNVKRAGTLYTAGGAIWFVTIIGSELVGFPWSEEHTTAFSIAEAIFIVMQTLLLIGFFGIWQSDGVGSGTFGKLAFGLAALGHLIFVLVEIHSLIIGELSPAFPLAPLSSAAGILLTGIAVLRAKRWQGWMRWMPLITGLYPFIFMFPFVAVTGETLDVAIGFWGLVRLVLGLAIRVQAEKGLVQSLELNQSGGKQHA